MQPDIQTLKELENSLLTPITNDAAVFTYLELKEEDLPPEVHGLFDQVETLVRLQSTV